MLVEKRRSEDLLNLERDDNVSNEAPHSYARHVRTGMARDA
jgi:hypothetical protein